MKSSALFFILIAVLSLATTIEAAKIDMDDPHRALGREDDIRIDAQLMQPTLAAGNPIGIVYQIQNFTSAPVAVADRVSDASWDPETRTITVAIGCEVPPAGKLPHMVTIGPGQKAIFRTSATPVINDAAFRSTRASAPRLVRIKVAVLRDISPFAVLIAKQSPAQQVLSDDLFEKWFESNDTIILNELPIQWAPRGDRSYDADQRMAARGSR